MAESGQFRSQKRIQRSLHCKHIRNLEREVLTNEKLRTRIVAARKAAGLTQKFVAENLRRADGRRVLPPFLNDSEHDRRYPPEDEVIDQLADILKLSSDVLYFYAKRVPPDVRRDTADDQVAAGYKAFRQVLADAASSRSAHSVRAILRTAR